MTAAPFAFEFTMLLQFWIGNGQKTFVVKFEAGNIMDKGINELEFKNVELIGELIDEYIYSAIEFRTKSPVSLRLATPKNTSMEHEWKMFKHMEATIELGNPNPTAAEAAEAGLPRVYGFGTIVHDTELNKTFEYKVIVTEPITGRPFYASLDSGDLAKDHETRYSLVLQMLKIIEYLHRKNTRHGYLAPSSFALLPSGEKMQPKKICLVKMHTAEICDADGYLRTAQTHPATKFYYQSLNMLNVLRDETEGRRFLPHINDDLESAAYTILRIFDVKLGWEGETTELSKTFPSSSMGKAKLPSSVLDTMKKMENKQTKMPNRILKKLLKDNPQFEVLLEMIESARHANLDGHINNYNYKVKSQKIGEAEVQFISMWISALAASKLGASGSSSKIFKMFKISGSSSTQTSHSKMEDQIS